MLAIERGSFKSYILFFTQTIESKEIRIEQLFPSSVVSILGLKCSVSILFTTAFHLMFFAKNASCKTTVWHSADTLNFYGWIRVEGKSKESKMKIGQPWTWRRMPEGWWAYPDGPSCTLWRDGATPPASRWGRTTWRQSGFSPPRRTPSAVENHCKHFGSQCRLRDEL